VEGAVTAAFDCEAYAVFFFELDGWRHGWFVCCSVSKKDARMLSGYIVTGRLRGKRNGFGR
jgi:hypothetical protein